MIGVAGGPGAAHHHRQRRTVGGQEWRVLPVEMAIGIGLVVLSAVLIFGIVKVVSSNLSIGR